MLLWKCQMIWCLLQSRLNTDHNGIAFKQFRFGQVLTLIIMAVWCLTAGLAVPTLTALSKMIEHQEVGEALSQLVGAISLILVVFLNQITCGVLEYKIN